MRSPRPQGRAPPTAHSNHDDPLSERSASVMPVPAPPPVDPARDHVRGPDGQRLLVYGDYECPYTRAAYRVVQALERRGTTFRFAFRHFPLTQKHPHALIATIAAEAAAELGVFWPMHDALMKHQDALEPDDLRRYATEEAGLDGERVARAPSGPRRRWTASARTSRAARPRASTARRASSSTARHLDSYEAGWLRERLEEAAAS